MRKWDWLIRVSLSALLSGLSLKFLDKPGAFYWGPGLAFALMVVTARKRKPELLAAVTLAYTLGYWSGNLWDWLSLPNQFQRYVAVALGSGLLALALNWKGGLAARQARILFIMGAVLGLPFWLLIDDGPFRRDFLNWSLAFLAWQGPVAWYYLKKA